MESIPYIVFEGEMARYERIIKRLVVVLIVTIAMLFVSNALWLNTFMQFDFETETVTLDASQGNANYIGNDGVINNGEGDSSEAEDDT